MTTTEIIAKLWEIEQHIAEALMDEQSKQEDKGNYSSGFGELCVPEDAAPELDNARAKVQEAIMELAAWEKQTERKWEKGVDGLDGQPHQE
jgi:hypothetical protein